MKRLLYYSIQLLLLLTFSFDGQTLQAATEPAGEIKGKVVTSDGQPAAFVSVQLQNRSRGTVTDDQGIFAFKKIQPGHYTLLISLVGYESVQKEIDVTDQATIEVVIQITASDDQLKQVIVLAGKNKFANKETEQVARMPLKNLENPQVYNVVGQEIMKEQVIIERTDIYRNIPGAVPNFAAGGSQGMSIRGFANSMGMRNGMVTSAIVPLNPVILERVEVLKGPSGTLFGSNRNVTFGGVYNYITKQPFKDFRGEFSFTTGSFQLSRITADINTPLNSEKTVLLRLNAAGQTEGSFQDQGYAKNYTFAPSLSYQVNDRLKFMVDIDITRSAYTTTTLAFGNLANITARSLDKLSLNYKSSLINRGIDIHNGINNIQARMEYKISNQWKSQTNYLYSEGYYKELLWTTMTMLTDSTVARTVRNQTPETFGNIQFQQNFIGDFLIGSFRNRMVVGIDVNNNYNELYRVTVPVDTINIRKSIPDLSADKIRDLSFKRGFAASKTKSLSYSLYVSDVFNITPSLMAMLSLRADRFTTDGTLNINTGKYAGAYDQNSLSPKLGLVYQVIKDQVAVFGNYMNGFVNLAPVAQPDTTVLELKPQFGNQWEAGVKFNLFNNKLSGSISLYDIAVTNSTRIDVINGRNFTVQDGTQNSRGYEVEVIGNPIAGLNIVAGYASNENKYDKASKALEGKFLTASPQHVANLWISYTVPAGKAAGFGFGAGGNYVSESWFESTNTMQIPAYTLLDATVFYDQPKFRVAIKGNNLLDEQYWNSNGTPQKPVNFLASVAFKF